MFIFLKSKAFAFILIFFVLIGISHVVRMWLNVGNNVGYAPEQPIPFNHQRHVTENGIPCLYCHSNADNSKHATVPPLNVCLNCHSVVKTDSPHIQKLKAAYDAGTSIEWVRVHDVPDHVYFSHKRHVLRGLACENCHGDVANMKKIEQVETLQMGFCVNCHRKPENQAPTECSTCHQ